MTYIMENVLKASDFTVIQLNLGSPLIVEAHKVGSSARRKTALWTNGATTIFLENDYLNH